MGQRLAAMAAYSFCPGSSAGLAPPLIGVYKSCRSFWPTRLSTSPRIFSAARWISSDGPESSADLKFSSNPPRDAKIFSEGLSAVLLAPPCASATHPAARVRHYGRWTRVTLSPAGPSDARVRAAERWTLDGMSLGPPAREWDLAYDGCARENGDAAGGWTWFS